MKNKFRHSILLILCVVGLQSCGTSLLYTSLDVLRPAKFSFEPTASKLLIINNTVSQPHDYGHKTLLLNEFTKNVTINTDSLALFCASALAEKLDEKKFFNTLQLDVNRQNNQTDFSKTYSLDSIAIANLCQKNDVDVILSLDRIKVNDLLSEEYIYETTSNLTALELNFESNWSIYYPNKKDKISMLFKDTLYWEAEASSRQRAMTKLPKREDALVDGALYVGQKTVNRIVPYWDKVDRYYFDSSNKTMRAAMDSIYVKNWTAAIRIWENTNNTSKSNWIKAQACNNLAVTNELLEDIDKAFDYANQAYYLLGTLSIVDYDYYERVALYSQELAKRKTELQLLKKQLGE